MSGSRLQHLDWGGTGPTLILLHDHGQNPHKFDAFAPAFTDRFRVIASARRGAMGSEAAPPYDVPTFAADLRELMDTLGIPKAIFVGHGLAGAEVTEMAVRYPGRVEKIVYLDAAYDCTDPDYTVISQAVPAWVFARPDSAMDSFDAFREYERQNWYSELDDMQCIETYLREVVVAEPSGRLRDRTSKEVNAKLHSALLTHRHDYERVQCPALAICTDYVLAVKSPDAQRRQEAQAWEQTCWQPFQKRSMERLRRELAGVEIRRVPGRQVSFYLTARERVVTAMHDFLLQ